MTPVDRAVLERLREEIVVATFPDGGLLVHLASGDIFQLDASAATIWRILTEADGRDQAAEAIRLALGLEPEDAALAVGTAFDQALALRDKPPPRATFRIEDREGSLALCRERAEQEQEPLLIFDRRRSALALGHRPDPAHPKEEDDIEALIRLFAPKVLATWFPLAMHASALEIAGHALLFSGASGAGKTTTARTLVEEIQGARLLSEDVVLFATVGEVSTIIDGAEPIIHAWIKGAASQLGASPTATVDAHGLSQSLEQHRRRTPLRKIVFLDASHRKGPFWSLRRLGKADALGALFLNSFIPSAAHGLLRQHLDVCRAVASGVLAFEATVTPAGLRDLRESSRAQSEMIVS